jgi:glycosyltransferase involved in cell wall biosynthesis
MQIGLSNRQMKVCFATDGIFPHAVGGMQRHSRLLIEELAKRNDIELTVIHPHPGINVFNNSRIKEIALPGIDTSKFYIRECYDYSKRVYEAVKKIECDVLYSQGISVWYKIDEVKHKLVVNLHGLEPYQAIGTKDKLIAIPFKWIFGNVLKKARVAVSEGGHLTDILKKIVPADRIVYLPNATNLPSVETNRSFGSDKLNILFMARFAGNKGIHILLQAVQELNNEGYRDRITYNLGGKGPLFGHYSSNAKYPNVNYLGFVADEMLGDLYKQNDLFVLPTLFEGMPTVVLEAMSHKMPIIVTDVGATKEMVDSSNGYLIEKNSVPALKKAILDFMKLGDEQKRSLADVSYRKLRKNFTWAIVAEKHMEMFRKIVNR